MPKKPDPDLQMAEALLAGDKLAVLLETPDDQLGLTLDQRIALAQARALVSIARSLDSLDRHGIDVIT